MRVLQLLPELKFGGVERGTVTNSQKEFFSDQAIQEFTRYLPRV